MSLFIESSKFVKKTSTGGYEQTNKALTAEDNITAMALKSYMAQMHELMNNALHNFDNTQRNISGISLGCSKATYDVLYAEIVAFKDRLKTIISQDTKSSQVYYLNIGLFPVSKDLKNESFSKGDDQ